MNGRKVLKWILNKKNVNWIIGVNIEIHGVPCKHGNEY
jgi:hypothetical protein